MTSRHLVSYRFNGQVRQHELELAQRQLLPHVAALHLLQLHFGDAENSLIMPSVDAQPATVMDQARLLGISGITSRVID
jgi:hypothetical protein